MVDISVSLRQVFQINVKQSMSEDRHRKKIEIITDIRIGMESAVASLKFYGPDTGEIEALIMPEYERSH